MTERLLSSHLPKPQDIEGFERLNALQAFAAENLDRLLNEASIFTPKLQIESASVVDFGCGGGGSSWYLKKLGADVIAVDLGDMDELRTLNVLPEGKMIRGDGIAYLHSIPESSLDLITAIMFGPDVDGNLAERFIPAAQRAIKPGGCIMIFSEIGSLAGVDRAARGASIRVGNNSRILIGKPLVQEDLNLIRVDYQTILSRLHINLPRFDFKRGTPLIDVNDKRSPR